MITGATQVITLLGQPVCQAALPAMMNERLREWEIDAAMVALNVPPGLLRCVVGGLSGADNWLGAVVTMPHKRAIVGMLDGLSPAVRASGACNVVRCDDGRYSGDMMDGRALRIAIERKGVNLAASSVALCGCGGAGAGIALALAELPVRSLHVWNRDLHRGAEVVAHLRTVCPSADVQLAGKDLPPCDVVINATSVGMRGEEAPPIALHVVEKAALVADIVISATGTALIQNAKRHDQATVDGREMLASQVDLLASFLIGSSTCEPEASIEG